MRLLHYLELENFKRFGDKQRIELDHPTVLIGPNNCGKTSAIQALALWSQAVKTWFDARKDSSARERTATPINRLSIVAVPVQRTRFFWHNTHVRTGNKEIALVITVGVEYRGEVIALPMRFRNQGDELVYCTPDPTVVAHFDLIRYAATLKVELLYPMSGLETEEPVLQPGRIDVLLGQGQTAQVLRNLCLMVATQSLTDWKRITRLMHRLFNVELTDPKQTSRGSIELHYLQPGVKEALDLSSSGRGFQQMLLIFAYLYSHKGSVLMVDEPDAHLEILRQKQIYVLLRDIASENESQVIMVTHSEVILAESLDHNLTLLLEGRADDLAKKSDIRNSLKYFGAEHYVKARERGYVLYVEGSTDIDILRALAERLNHPLLRVWDESINSFYVQNNYPDQDQDAELERVEGGFGMTPKEHFNNLRNLLPQLRGLAILDHDGYPKKDLQSESLTISYWKRYEIENYFITPDILYDYVNTSYSHLDTLPSIQKTTVTLLDTLIQEQIFDNEESHFLAWKRSPTEVARLLWEAKTERIKLSLFAEAFFRKLSHAIGKPMLLKKGELHQLIKSMNPQIIAPEVSQKLDLLADLLRETLTEERSRTLAEL